jgi:hypothetical protein
VTRSLKKTESKIELRPDGWERFMTAVTAAAKSGPKHRPSVARQPKAKQSKSVPNRTRPDIDMHREKGSEGAEKGKSHAHKNAPLPKLSRI